MRAGAIRLFTHMDRDTERPKGQIGPVDKGPALSIPAGHLFVVIVQAVVQFDPGEEVRNRRIGGVIVRDGQPAPRDAVPNNTTPIPEPPPGERSSRLITTAISSTPPVAGSWPVRVALLVDGKEVGRSHAFRLEVHRQPGQQE